MNENHFFFIVLTKHFPPLLYNDFYAFYVAAFADIDQLHLCDWLGVCSQKWKTEALIAGGLFALLALLRDEAEVFAVGVLHSMLRWLLTPH